MTYTNALLKEGAPENSRTEDSDDDQQEEEVELDKIKSSNLSKTKSEAVRGAVKSVGVLNFPFSLTRKIREQSLNVKFHNASENTEEALTGFMNRLAALTPDSIARQMTLTESYLIKNIQVRKLQRLSVSSAKIHLSPRSC